MVAVVLGSAFSEPSLDGRALEPHVVNTPRGEVLLHRWPGRGEAWVLFRHGAPHQRLPHQIDFRAQAAALAEVGAGSVLLQSSVGVLDERVPLFEPLLASDLVMLENRLPDGSLCTMFEEPVAGQGHLVLEGGVFDVALSDQVSRLAAEAGVPVVQRVNFTYVAGPRTKTRAENALLGKLGCQTNSMSVGPEAVLACELGLSVAALLVGHKHSLNKASAGNDQAGIDDSLRRARLATEAIVSRFLDDGVPVATPNRLHRLGA